MFRKIVSQLSFSPALVGQLSFYAKRLRKEQLTRRMGLIFVALALVVQSLVVFQAPEPANAASSNDFIVGGLGYGSNVSLGKFLGPYDRNERHLKDVFNYFGITREEITQTHFGSFKVGTTKSYGYENRAGSATIPITDGNFKHVTTIYGRPLSSWGNHPNTDFWGFIGYSKKIGWFAITQACGNLVTNVYPTPPQPPAPAQLSYSKSGVNTTQGNVDATKTTAKANDKITYTVQARNTGGTAATTTLTDDLSGVLKYARLIDNGGGSLNAATGILSWPNTPLAPGATVVKKYTVQVNSSLINTVADCSIINKFMNQSVTTRVDCKTPPANIVSSKKAINTSQRNVDATKTTAVAKDTIRYTVKASNTGGTAASVDLKDDLSQVLTYAKLTSNGGGTFDSKTQTLSWGKVTLKPGESVTKTYTIQINESLISTSTNCTIRNDFLGNTTVIPVGCSTRPAELSMTKTAVNTSQGNVDATKATAKENDRINFTLTIENTGGTAKEFTFEDDVSDALEYAKIIDNGGGTFDEASKKLRWPAVTLKPGDKQVRTFTMQILPTIPATPKGLSDPSSYDCKIENTFLAASVVIPVTCPTPKVIETVVPELPKTGPTENMIFAGIVLAVATFFYYRSKQLGTEVRLIRRDVNGGTI